MKAKTKAQVIPFRSVRGRSTRPFVALHKAGSQVIRRTFAATLPSAIKFSVQHLWLDSYGARTVQVFDRRTEVRVATLTKNADSVMVRRIK